MRKAVVHYCRLRGGKGVGKWWEERTENAVCPRCGERKRHETRLPRGGLTGLRLPEAKLAKELKVPNLATRAELPN